MTLEYGVAFAKDLRILADLKVINPSPRLKIQIQKNLLENAPIRYEVKTQGNQKLDPIHIRKYDLFA